MNAKAKIFSIETNLLKAPAYIHRYLTDGKNGWRIQPTGYIREFLDDEYGSPEKALEVAKATMRLITELPNTTLLTIFNPQFRTLVKTDGTVHIFMIVSRGMHSKHSTQLNVPYKLSADTIAAMGKRWVGTKVYDFSVKELPSWFPVSCRSQAFEAWKKELLRCANQSLASF